MKVFIPGPEHSFAMETSVARELRRSGMEVVTMDTKPPVPALGGRTWWDLPRWQRPVHDAWISYRFERRLVAEQPSVVFALKADNIHSFAMRKGIERTGAKLVYWYPDHPFKADQTSMNILRNLPRTSLFYIWGKFLVEPLQAAGCPRVEYLPFAFDPEMHGVDVDITDADRARFGADITFVGTWDLERERDLEPLAEFNLAIWGPGWTKHLSRHSPLASKVRGEGVFNEDLVKAFRCSKLVFNHLRQHNGSAHNMRTMEIPGIGGGVQVTRRTPEQAAELFTEGEDILCFDGTTELRAVVNESLKDPARLTAMSSMARQRVFRSHLYKHRFETVVNQLRALQ